MSSYRRQRERRSAPRARRPLPAPIVLPVESPAAPISHRSTPAFAASPVAGRQAPMNGRAPAAGAWTPTSTAGRHNHAHTPASSSAASSASSAYVTPATLPPSPLAPLSPLAPPSFSPRSAGPSTRSAPAAALSLALGPNGDFVGQASSSPRTPSRSPVQLLSSLTRLHQQQQQQQRSMHGLASTPPPVQLGRYSPQVLGTPVSAGLELRKGSAMPNLSFHRMNATMDRIRASSRPSSPAMASLGQPANAAAVAATAASSSSQTIPSSAPVTPRLPPSHSALVFTSPPALSAAVPSALALQPLRAIEMQNPSTEGSAAAQAHAAPNGRRSAEYDSIRDLLDAPDDSPGRALAQPTPNRTAIQLLSSRSAEPPFAAAADDSAAAAAAEFLNSDLVQREADVLRTPAASTAVEPAQSGVDSPHAIHSSHIDAMEGIGRDAVQQLNLADHLCGHATKASAQVAESDGSTKLIAVGLIAAVGVVIWKRHWIEEKVRGWLRR